MCIVEKDEKYLICPLILRFPSLLISSNLSHFFLTAYLLLSSPIFFSRIFDCSPFLLLLNFPFHFFFFLFTPHTEFYLFVLFLHSTPLLFFPFLISLNIICTLSWDRCWSSEVNHPCPGVLKNVPAARNYEGGFGSGKFIKIS